jgi:hypothetical protein
MKLQDRINLEKRIARKVVRALLDAGYELTINNGGEGNEIPWSRNFSEVMAAMFATDDEHLITRKPDAFKDDAPLKSFVYFVYGNDGWDVICDYGVSLEPVLAPINDYADQLSLKY